MSTPVIESVGYTRISASQLIKTGQGRLLGIFVTSASATPTITLYDNTAASGTQITGAFTPAGATFYAIPVNFANLYVAIGGTVDCTILWEPVV